MKQLEEYLDSIGKKGDIKRLEAIASMDLGLRSEAASRACENRYRRKELMNRGFSHSESIIIFNYENRLNCQNNL